MDAETPEDLRQPRLDPADFRSIFFGVMLAMFLSALDGTIVATAMPTMGRELGDVQHLPWVVTSYLLASTAVTPLYGKFADMHGRRVTMLAGIIVFVLGSVACALAPSMIALAVARALQGLGGGGLIALAQTIIGDLVPPRERGRYQVYFGSVFASASVLGPVLGGFFAESLHWSWIFWINLPLGLGALWLVNSRLKLLPRVERRHSLDIAGAVLMIGASTSLMLAVSQGGHDHPWLSGRILGLLGASAALWVLFGVRLATAREPLIPLAVLGDRVVATGTMTSAFVMGTYVGLSIIVPIYFEIALGLSARLSGLALIAFMVAVPIGATVSGHAMAALPRYKRVPVAGLTLTVLATALLAASAGRAPFWAVELILGALAFGLGTVFPVATVAVQNAVESHHLGTATATMNFSRQLTASLIVAAFGAITLGGGAALEAGAGRAGIPLSAFATVFWVAAGGFALALLILCLMEERLLRGRSEALASGQAPE